MDRLPLCGIDEAGRGPLAGPLIMTGVILKEKIDGLADSKQLSEKRREILFSQIIQVAHYCIVRFSPEEIDTIGISKCLSRGLRQIQRELPKAHYLFDGNSTFGVANIKTIVKADTKIPEVSAASILAKVTRDREMIEMANIYSKYGFERHKGYATKAHYEALLRYGRCFIHRKSFYVKGLDEIMLFK
ncbi:MAG: ribonuclease HII [Sulfurovum sp.]|nr:ribonuclease HII [Sulfurovum sp.]